MYKNSLYKPSQEWIITMGALESYACWLSGFGSTQKKRQAGVDGCWYEVEGEVLTLIFIFNTHILAGCVYGSFRLMTVHMWLSVCKDVVTARYVRDTKVKLANSVQPSSLPWGEFTLCCQPLKTFVVSIHAEGSTSQLRVQLTTVGSDCLAAMSA
jgi:hypothetical protein